MRTLKDSGNIYICHIVDFLYQTNGVGPVICVVPPIIIHLIDKVFVILDVFCKIFANSCVKNRYLRGSIIVIFLLGFGAKDRVQLVEFLEPVI
jgi:hypothetical protein